MGFISCYLFALMTEQLGYFGFSSIIVDHEEVVSAAS